MLVNAIVYLYPMNEGVSHTLERLLSITIRESVESLCKDCVDAGADPEIEEGGGAHIE